MSTIAFNDQNDDLCKAAIEKSYKYIETDILNNRANLTEYICHNGHVFGYKITTNQPLSKLYSDSFYVVKYYFSKIDTLHDKEIEEVLITLLLKLKSHIKENNGYYNIRLATHIVDLMKAYNYVFTKSCFCGGTVEEYTFGKEVKIHMKDGLKIFFADEAYLASYKKELLEITYTSFQSYQGQYHISPVTEYKAGHVYKNWIDSEFNSFTPNTILIAEYNGIPCGFVTIDESEFHVEGKLAAVSDKFRGIGTYRNMIGYLINYANKQHKAFLSSTQFDNFTVQGAWAKLGLKPFYSIYNFHIDARAK